MKCEKCNQNEAILHYTTNINGEVSEAHLCADCAKAEGFGELMQKNWFGFENHSLFDHGFGRDLLGGSLFDDFFGGSMFPGFGRGLMAPSIAFPRIRIRLDDPSRGAAAPAETAVSSDDRIPADAGEEIRRKREINALKHQLEEAVRAEEFERCVELQKQIRELEAKEA